MTKLDRIEIRVEVTPELREALDGIGKRIAAMDAREDTILATLVEQANRIKRLEAYSHPKPQDKDRRFNAPNVVHLDTCVCQVCEDTRYTNGIPRLL